MNELDNIIADANSKVDIARFMLITSNGEYDDYYLPSIQVDMYRSFEDKGAQKPENYMTGTGKRRRVKRSGQRMVEFKAFIGMLHYYGCEIHILDWDARSSFSMHGVIDRAYGVERVFLSDLHKSVANMVVS